MDPARVHGRFTLHGAGSLRGDPKGMWTTFRHLEERVAAERAAVVRYPRAAAGSWMADCGGRDLIVAAEGIEAGDHAPGSCAADHPDENETQESTSPSTTSS